MVENPLIGKMRRQQVHTNELQCDIHCLGLSDDLKRCLSNHGEQVPYDVAPSQEDTDYSNGKVRRGRAVLCCLFSYGLFPKEPLLASAEDRADLRAEATLHSSHSQCYCHIMRAGL